jgi:hypothetical protein
VCASGVARSLALVVLGSLAGSEHARSTIGPRRRIAGE